MMVLRESGYVAVPWKNGGGLTREILRVPPEPVPFEWRLSLATIDRAGPFSAFAGYRRTLVLVRGAGVELRFTRPATPASAAEAEPARLRLDTVGQVARFDGGWETSCTLLDGPSTDLNLIVSELQADSQSRSIDLRGRESIQTGSWTETLVCCISGSVTLTNTTGRTLDLAPVDVARCAPEDGAITCEPGKGSAAVLFVAQLRKI